MKDAVRQHPSPEQLRAFGQGRLSAAAATELESHIARCEQCCRALREVPDDTLIQRLRTCDTPAETPPAEPAPPAGTPSALAAHPRYRIVKPLGTGGMGTVYLAEHRLMERQVALKVIHPELLSDPQALARFRTEVRAAARLGHPNIVAAYDAEQAGELQILAMEYIDGITLARLVEKRGRLHVGLACEYVRQAALGLQHAHEQGMVHRDIKPHNLMLTRQGQVKVLDFGLARLAPAGTIGRRRRITAVGSVLGTPDYIAPEQASDASEADIRADLYSLGCTLYFLLAGQPPFPQGSATKKLSSHIQGVAAPLGLLRPDAPVALVAVVERLMAKDPDDRYRTPQEVADALAPFARLPLTGDERARPRVVVPDSDSPTERDLQPVHKPRKWTRSGAALLAFTALVLLAMGLWPRGKAPERTPREGDARAEPSQPARQEPPGSNLPPGVRKQSTVLFVVSNRGFWYPDYGPVRQALEKGGVKVVVASSALTPAVAHDRGQGEPPVQPDLLLQDAKADDFDAVYFPGGQPLEFRPGQPAAPAARKLIIDMQAKNKYVAALCTGVAVLAEHGVLRDKPAAQSKYLQLFRLPPDAARWEDRPVVIHGRLITGGDWEHAEAFARELLSAVTSGR